MKMEDVNSLIKSAVNGDKLAAQSLIARIQDKVYGLCLRMLWQTEDSQEACQEILIKVVARLAQFKFESRFETWVYQIATNHLIDKKRSQARNLELNFSSFEKDLLSEQLDPSLNEVQSPEYKMQLTEIRLSCTTALLQCLDVNHRLAYILGEIIELDHLEASIVLDISATNFRKRLERAKQKVEEFTKRVCGVISPVGSCQCSRRLGYSKSCDRIDLEKLPFVRSSKSQSEVVDYIQKIELAKRTSAHYRKTKNFSSPKDFSVILDMVATHPKGRDEC